MDIKIKNLMINICISHVFLYLRNYDSNWFKRGLNSELMSKNIV